MELCDCLESRKSVRSFLPKQVDKKVPKKIVEAANRSPSDMNTQPWKVFDTGWLSIYFPRLPSANYQDYSSSHASASALFLNARVFFANVPSFTF